MKNKLRLYIFILFISFLLFVLDLVLLHFLNPVLNPKIIFGTSGSNYYGIVLSLICITVISLFFLMRKNISPVPFILIISGGLTNLFERLLLGGIIDYLDCKFLPTFNISDFLIVFGFILIVISLIKTPSSSNRTTEGV